MSQSLLNGDTRNKVLLLGSTGLLGSTLGPFLADQGFDVKTHGHSGGAQFLADLTSPSDTRDLLDEVSPDIVLNLVGLTNVDSCEENPNRAYLENVRVVENVARWIKSKSFCHLVQVSTDQVYDGDGLHVEDNVTLTNCYAFSKYAGELVATGLPSTIIRTNFFGRSHCAKRASLTDWLNSRLSIREGIQVFDDVVFSPISMKTLSKIIVLIMQKKPLGVFNLGSHGGMSKADFAFLFAKEMSYSTNTMTRTSSRQVTFLKSYRPKNMRMDISKIESALNISLPLLSDEIKRAAREYYEEA